MPPLPNQTPDTVKLTTFLRNVAGISTSYLPDASPVIQHSFDQAMSLVSLDFAGLSSATTSWSPYELGVYNLATHLLIEYAPDVSYTISALAWTRGVVTATTATAHSIMPGDVVRIMNVSPLAYSGVNPSTGVTITETPDNTHFGYRLATNPGSATILSGAAAREMFFENVRKQLKINSFVPGVVASTSDLSTSVSFDNPDFFKNLTLDQLQLLKTPYGRNYLALAQKYGPSVWGLTV